MQGFYADAHRSMKMIPKLNYKYNSDSVLTAASCMYQVEHENACMTTIQEPPTQQ